MIRRASRARARDEVEAERVFKSECRRERSLHRASFIQLREYCLRPGQCEDNGMVTALIAMAKAKESVMQLPLMGAALLSWTLMALLNRDNYHFK